MGFSSIDDWLNKVTNNGYFLRTDWTKQNPAAFVIGRWYDFSLLPGIPPLNSYGELVWNPGPVGSTWGWTLGANWVYINNSFMHTTGSAENISQPLMATRNGAYYQVTYTLAFSLVNGGSITVSVNGTNGTARSTSATFTEVIGPVGASGGLVFTPTTTAQCTISAISVIEVAVGGTPMAFIMNDTIPSGVLYSGGNKSPKTKHIINAGIVSSIGTGMPGIAMLCDLLMAYPLINGNTASAQALTTPEYTVNGTFTGSSSGWTLGAAWAYVSNAVNKNADGTNTLSQTTIIAPVAGKVYNVTYTISNFSIAGTITVGFGGGTASARTLANGTYTETITATGAGNLIFTPTNLSRFTIDTVSCQLAQPLPRYSDGVGVKAFLVATTALGATTPLATTITYTGSTGVSGVTTQMTINSNSPASSAVGTIVHSGTSVGNYGPFIPLAAGDSGVRSVQSITMAASGSASTIALVLAKPLFSIPISTLGVLAEKDMLNQFTSMPQVQDGAYLSWIFLAGATTAANTPFFGYCDICWG